ncbi:hypothetical protein J1N35_018847 [Gossypium stocksii]|uniref:Uncharacterized protein n=1 Tax=Gossypium stocksii TaxID=47602 RepID=A0A9D3VR94_9ROSI|nr:hypothetical protein J1N35_018847 [Gossypium stocksii]
MLFKPNSLTLKRRREVQTNGSPDDPIQNTFASYCMTIVVALLSRSEKLCLREAFTSAWASGLLPEYIRTYVLREIFISAWL